jgi:uncharacterized protein (TIGR02391 family)
MFIPFDLTPEQVVGSPTDLLALRILQDVHTNAEWNHHNWMVKAQQGPYGGNRAALEALEEAWAWLRAKGFIARDPQQSSPESIFVTRRGRHAVEEGIARMRAEERLDVDLHQRIAERTRSQFLLGEYELAAFAAFREVEERVRDLSGLGPEDYGVELINKALSPGNTESLADHSVPEAERKAMMLLFAGAYGLFRNPVSHRTVDLGDVTMASEVVLLADLLLRMLDRTEQRLRERRAQV